MATIKTVKYVCPHCGRTANSMFGLPQKKLKFYGCTLRRCRRCLEPYVDHRVTEIGMYPKEETYPSWHQFYLGWVIYGLFVVIGIGVLAYQLGLTNTMLYFGVWLLAGGYVAQLLTNLLMLNWRRRRWQEEYDSSLAHMASQRKSG